MSDTITALSVQNYKGVREITLKPEGSLVVLAGGNGQGKSSFIDAISEIFDPSGVRLTPKPIRTGETRASAEVTTDTARIVRTWTKDDAGKLEAFALDGAKYPSGKDFVLKATGGALFDPRQFVDLSDKEQRVELLARVKLPFNLDQLDRERKGIFDGRTDVNRKVAELEGQLKGYPLPDPSLPVEEVSAADLLSEAETAREHNALIERVVDALSRAELDVGQAQAELERARKVLDEAQARLDVQRTEFAKLPDKADTSALGERLATVEQTNARIREQKQRTTVAADLSEKKERAAHLTLELQTIDTRKKDALAGAKFPVEGLSVDESGITVDGIPFRQINTAMKTRIAFDLATLPQPDLRLIVIKGGDSLDADSLAEIGHIADERGYIVLVERDRDESREIGFTIQEGSVRA